MAAPPLAPLLAELATAHTAVWPPLHTLLSAILGELAALRARVDALDPPPHPAPASLVVANSPSSPAVNPPPVTNPPQSPTTKPPPGTGPPPSPITNRPRSPAKHPTTPHPRPIPAVPASTTPTPRPSSRLKRPQRRSKRSSLTLSVLYSDDLDLEHASDATPAAPAPTPATTPPLAPSKRRKASPAPLADVTNTPSLSAFRTPAAAVRAAGEISRAARQRDTLKCKDVVRGPERAALDAAACPECDEFFKKEAEGREDPQRAYQEMVAKACRHRQRFLPKDTPDDFWKLTFEETQTQPPPPSTPLPPPPPPPQRKRSARRSGRKKTII